MGAIGNTGLYLAQVLSDHHTYRQCPQVKMLTLELIFGCEGLLCLHGRLRLLLNAGQKHQMQNRLPLLV